MEILRVTAIACLARSGLPAPSSFDTLVLFQQVGFIQWNELQKRGIRIREIIDDSTA